MKEILNIQPNDLQAEYVVYQKRHKMRLIDNGEMVENHMTSWWFLLDYGPQIFLRCVKMSWVTFAETSLGFLKRGGPGHPWSRNCC